jgi:type I restriction enzyme S subunit
MKLQLYPKYKDSGIEWLGKVPVGWEILKLKYGSDVIMGQSPSSDDYSDDSDMLPFLQGNADFTTRYPIPRVYCDSANKIISKGSILVSVRAPVGALNEADQEYGIGRGLCAVKPKSNLLKEYAWYQLHVTRMELDSLATGSTYDAVSVDEVADMTVLVPHIDDQQAIASFLDRETSRIDALIQKKERLIELLKAKRIAMITQAVTKGLDPNVPMKDSGIELLGEVPEHWEMKRMKDLLLPKKGAIKTGPFGSQLLSSEMEESDVKIYNQKSVISKDFEYGENYISFDKFEDLKEFQTYPGDFLITTRGTIGRCAILPPDSEKGILHPCLMRLQTNKNVVDDRFLEILIEESQVILEQLKLKSNGTTIEVIYQDSLKNVTVLLPPLHEQLLIAEYLDLKTNRIDILIHQIETSVNLLREYRSSLINAAVTGKIDLREAL